MAESRGSQWRKWDLHVHAPTTKLNNGYGGEIGEAHWKRFCDIIQDSDVAAVGITDYFNLDPFFDFKERYEELYPDDHRVFFPNLELRLDHAVHRSGSEVNIHLILPPSLTRVDADRLLHNIVLTNSDPKFTRNLTCGEVKSWPPEDLKSVSVQLESLRDALKNTFDGIRDENLTDAAVIVVSGRNDGNSPGEKASNIAPRKAALIDRIDAKTDAVFSRAKDAEYWLSESRYEGEGRSIPKPTFGGCDAHSFEDLEKMLGRTGADSSREWEATWVKADLSYEGLLQTLVESELRVAIQEEKPEFKEPYHVIDRIEFVDSDDFPSRIEFNEGLNVIVGSRSSGKSSLLSYIAYAIDSETTRKQQAAASGIEIDRTGPAAGFSWNDVGDLRRQIAWVAPEQDAGSVIFVPQNSLYSLGDRPTEVTERIKPLLFRNSPEIEKAEEEYSKALSAAKEHIDQQVNAWFTTRAEIDHDLNSLKQQGDEAAIRAAKEKLSSDLAERRREANFSEETSQKYDEVITAIELSKTKRRILDEEVHALESLDGITNFSESEDFIRLVLVPGLEEFPESVRSVLSEEVDKIEAEAAKRLNHVVGKWAESAQVEKQQLAAQLDEIETENKDLFLAYRENKNFQVTSRKILEYEESLAGIEKSKEHLRSKQGRLVDIAKEISGSIQKRSAQLIDYKEEFDSSVKSVEGLVFKFEFGSSESQIQHVSDQMKKNVKSAFLSIRPGTVEKACDFQKAQNDVKDFLEQVYDKSLQLKNGVDRVNFSREVLDIADEVRFSAIFDGDSIGGFSDSTMTPGKRALFALTLILGNADHPWPLLIDQPEDDLDSRSIFDIVVPFLRKKKRERQIIMVTHDANLAIGADADEIIVANRHGDDRPNSSGRTFEYCSGPIESSFNCRDETNDTLLQQGIREHCCEILDGGVQAFEVRKKKYKI